ncbi:cytochrome P450 [Imleria badia]|nr:cytochrome P450 [Imleria badia]
MANMISLESLQVFLGHNLSAVHRLRFVNVAYALGALYAVLKVFRVTRRRLKTTALRGPSNPSLVWGVGKALLLSPDTGEVYEKWAEEYGGVYEVPLALGRRNIVLCDPKAIAHFFGGETRTWAKKAYCPQRERVIVVWRICADKTGYRQRKTLTPAFSNAAIRNLTPVFYDSAHKAAVDHVIPLSKPVHTRSGKLVDHISVAKGAYVSVSALSINRSTAFWGPDAKEFKPERWIGEDGIPDGAKEIQGHRHLLTFIDGPRTCLGKGFAIAEFKIVLSILVKNFVFELRDGPETVIELARGILPRPKVAGEQGTAVPLRVRRFE